MIYSRLARNVQSISFSLRGTPRCIKGDTKAVAEEIAKYIPVPKSHESKNLLLGVTGSIAAYRTPDLAAQLRRAEFDVKTILSPAVEQFVTPASIAAMSRGEVYTNADMLSNVWHPTHIELSDWADVAIIAPTSAATIGKLACGISEGLLLESFLALAPDVPKFIAPAMNGKMLNQLSVQRNIDQLQVDGYQIISPRIGELACGYSGEGKIATIKEVVTSLSKCA